MKARVQKPIQSLHAFRRYHFGGGHFCPPLILRTVLFCILAGWFGTGTVSAQDIGDSNRQGADGKRLDLLFDQIMRTLPEGARSKVDSAATVKVDRRSTVPATAAPDKLNAGDAAQPRERLNDLPDELKAQVERAISDMEQRKEERKAQFREFRRNSN